MPQFEKIYRFNSIDASENDDWIFSNPDGSTGLGSANGSTKRVWNWDSNATASSNVGPLGPEEGNGYIYTEASSPAKDKDEFSIETEVDGSDRNIELSFWYSADTNNSKVQLIVEAYNGKKWTKEFDQNIAGDTADWKFLKFDLNHYSNPDLKIKISIVLLKGGTVWHKDVGIDTIKISGTKVELNTPMSSWLTSKGLKFFKGKKKKEWLKHELSSSQLKQTIKELELELKNNAFGLDDDYLVIEETPEITHIIHKEK